MEDKTQKKPTENVSLFYHNKFANTIQGNIKRGI